MLHPLALVPFVGLMATPIQVPVAQEVEGKERPHLITAVQMMTANRVCNELLYSPVDWGYFIKLDAATEGVDPMWSEATAKMAMALILRDTRPEHYPVACEILKQELAK